MFNANVHEVQFSYEINEVNVHDTVDITTSCAFIYTDYILGVIVAYSQKIAEFAIFRGFRLNTVSNLRIYSPFIFQCDKIIFSSLCLFTGEYLVVQ